MAGTLILGAGLVGQALRRRLPDARMVSRQECDLRNPAAVKRLFHDSQPHHVYLAAAKVGGISANAANPIDFLQDNLRIQMNVIEACYRWDVRKVLFFGSSCIYPKHAPQPIREDALMTGPLEPTNEAYAIAKIAGIKLAQAYAYERGLGVVCVMPTNLYGPHDNFDRNTGHVVPALMRKFHEAVATGAEEVVVWGTGTPRRELMHVDDLADACAMLMDRCHSPQIINVGSGHEVTIQELAEILADITGFSGRIRYDHSMPDGTPRKLLWCGTLRQVFGWTPRVMLRTGLEQTYAWFRENVATSGVAIATTGVAIAR